MGLTLIQRSSGHPPPRNPKVALVLAGGAVSGGAFKVGGLKALDDFLGERKVNELDIYVGLSAGAFLATALAGGLSPREAIGILDGSSSRFSQMRPTDFYRLNLKEMLVRPMLVGTQVATFLPGLILDLVSVLPDLPERLGPALRRLYRNPSYTNLERLLMQLQGEVSPKRALPPLSAILPSGIFDNAALERWLSRNIASIGMPNNFADLYRETGRRLFVTATNLELARDYFSQACELRFQAGCVNLLDPVSVRAASERGSLGNRVSTWIFPLPVGVADPREQLAQITKTTTELKESKQAVGADVLMQAAEWTPSTILSLAARNLTRMTPFNTVVTNVPGPQQPMYMLGSRLVEVYPHVPLVDNLGLGIALMSYDGRVFSGFNADYDLVPDLEHFVVLIERSFAELAAAAGVEISSSIGSEATVRSELFPTAEGSQVRAGAQE